MKSYYHDPLEEGADPEDTRASDYHRECGFLWEQHIMFDVPTLDPEDGTEIGQEYECPKRLIIAGGRNYGLTSKDYDSLDSLLPIGEVLSGGANGADSYGEDWAWLNNIPVERFLPDWETHGKAAGPIRNREMAEYATAVALFPGGRGTESMRHEAVKAGIEIFDYRETEDET